MGVESRVMCPYMVINHHLDPVRAPIDKVAIEEHHVLGPR